jgi:hypothetical protein
MTGGSHLRGPPVSGRQRQKGRGTLRLELLLGWRGWAVAHSGKRGEERGAGWAGQVRASN